jgi:hypothetical protein
MSLGKLEGSCSTYTTLASTDIPRSTLATRTQKHTQLVGHGRGVRLLISLEGIVQFRTIGVQPPQQGVHVAAL